jgi:hypothetical protein
VTDEELKALKLALIDRRKRQYEEAKRKRKAESTNDKP